MKRKKPLLLALAAMVLCAVLVCLLCLTGRDAQPPALSSGVQNIVKRACQLTDIQWTPQKDLTGWGGSVVYRAGRTYTGLPYGQPVYTGYVPYDVSLPEFAAAVRDPDSRLYSEYSTYNKIAPCYSIDCSAFVSWAWGLPFRQTTATLSSYADVIWEKPFEQMEVGDAFCKPGSHVVLVTALRYNRQGAIVGVEIAEAAVHAQGSLCRRVNFGENSTQTMDDFRRVYGDYYLYRCRTREQVVYTHNCTVPLVGDVCEKCFP